jgi:DNA-binding IclR family transcriptional regulator
MALEGHKLIQRDFKTGGYRPGERLFELGMCAISQLGLCAHAHPILECLVQETDETVCLWVHDDGEVVCIDELEPARSIRLATTLGRRDSAFCTAAGKAIMAIMLEEQIDASVQKYGLRHVMKKA